MNWFIDVLKNKYAKFDGRAGRAEYWFFYLFYFITTVVLFVLSMIPYAGLVFSLVLLVFALGTIVPSIAAAVRRLHDTNRSGWWMLICLVPFVGGIILLVFLILEGTAGDNNFGPPAPTAPGQ